MVTVASSGIGRGIAIACARMGANVIVTARNLVRLQETLAAMLGDKHAIIVADLIDKVQRKLLVEQLPVLALVEARKENKLHGNVLLAGFGVGLSWGGVILKCE